ncbi:vitamin K epoxide reductase family protein [Patescibacteria group bacterium]|nr:vitamin K epoxide reductase family protein [Patescibacteria group bacterium]MBU1906764.1 vitamin K epoxide reductase family protein [Patescibacteria group bacterium]
MKKFTSAIFVLAIIGAAISAFLYVQHIGLYSTEICEINATFDCKSVDSSAYSEIYGVPISLMGIIGYGLMALGALLKLLDKKSDRGLDWFLLLSIGGGFAFSLYLTSIEAFVLHAWCIFCVAQQFIILIMFVLAVMVFRKSPHIKTLKEEPKPENYDGESNR